MYHLARRWTSNDFAAAFAGVAFSFNGLTLNLLMWPSHIATLGWMPWVVLAVEGAWRKAGGKFPAAMAGAMQMLAGGPETIFLTWLLLLALWIQQLATGRACHAVAGRATARPYRSGGARRDIPAVSHSRALVIALSAVQLLPFLDLAAHSERHGNYADFRWSMPAWGWANSLCRWLLAAPATWASSSIRPVVDFLVLPRHRDAVAGVAGRLAGASGPCPNAGAVAVIALIFALGEHTPVYPALHRLIPVLSLITYQDTGVVVAFAAPLLAAFGLAACKTMWSAVTCHRFPKRRHVGALQNSSTDSFSSVSSCSPSSAEFFSGAGLSAAK